MSGLLQRALKITSNKPPPPGWRVGDIIYNYLFSINIKERRKGGGCGGCSRVRAGLNKQSTELIRLNIKYWVAEMFISSSDWLKEEKGVWKLVEHGPEKARKAMIRALILWACDEWDEVNGNSTRTD